MSGGDTARKKNLVDFGFRLPSAYDNRPLYFHEFEERVGQAVLVSATPALAMIPEMNKRGKVVISAALVSCVCTFGAHFAFTNTVAPELVPALLTAKLTGCFLGLVIGLLATRRETE